MLGVNLTKTTTMEVHAWKWGTEVGVSWYVWEKTYKDCIMTIRWYDFQEGLMNWKFKNDDNPSHTAKNKQEFHMKKQNKTKQKTPETQIINSNLFRAQPNVQVYVPWEETGSPGESSFRHQEIMTPPHRKSQAATWTRCFVLFFWGFFGGWF